MSRIRAASPPHRHPRPGESILAALKMGVHLVRQSDFITDYEVKLRGRIAEVLCGAVIAGTTVSERYILDLEREGFKIPLRRKAKPGENSVRAEDREDAEELNREDMRNQKGASPPIPISRIEWLWQSRLKWILC